MAKSVWHSFNTSQEVVRSFSGSQVIANHCHSSLNKINKLRIYYGATEKVLIEYLLFTG
jgi:hypothetical protein